MKKVGKRGLSAVVTTLIIILLAIVLVGIVWVVVANVVGKGVEQVDLTSRCLSIDFSFVSVLPVEDQPENYLVTLTRSSGGETISGVKLVLFNLTENSGVLEFGGSMGPLDTKSETVEAGILNANRVDLTPYFLDESNREELCPQVRSFVLGSSGSATPVEGEDGGDGGDGGDGENGEEDTGGEGDPCTVDEDCDTGFECSDGSCQCKYEQDENGEIINEKAACEGEEFQCETASICGQAVDCSTATGGCAFGEFCSSNICVPDNIINTGSVEDIFTSSEPFQFSSQDLPNPATLNLQAKYINFTDLTDCPQIDFHGIIPNSSTEIYVRLDDVVPELEVGINYTVWNNTKCGLWL